MISSLMFIWLRSTLPQFASYLSSFKTDPNKIWYDPNYRGQFCPPYDHLTPIALTTPIYPEHNASYLAECVRNLAAKGIIMPTT